MMYVWVELVCCKCANTTAGQFISTGVVPKMAMKAEAKSNGWELRKPEADGRHDWFCPPCCKALDDPDSTQ